MLSVEALTDRQRISSLAPEWDRLCRVSHQPAHQLEYGHMSLWFDTFFKEWRPLVLVVRNDKEVLGILPLKYRDEKRRNILPFRRVRMMNYGASDFSALLAPPENTVSVVDAAFTWLFDSGFRWELFIVDDVIEGNVALPAIRSWLAGRTAAHSVTEGRYFYIDLARPWEDIVADMHSKFIVRNVTKARNRITKAGAWEVLKNPGWDSQTIVREAAALHILRQDELKRESFFKAEESLHLLQRAVEYYLDRGMFSAYWLMFQGTPIAYNLGFVQAGVFYGWNMAFHPDFAQFDPSKLLLFETIRDFHQQGLQEFSFGRGEGDYKTKWTSSCRVNYRLDITNTSTVYGRFLSFIERRLAA